MESCVKVRGVNCAHHVLCAQLGKGEVYNEYRYAVEVESRVGLRQFL